MPPNGLISLFAEKPSPASRTLPAQTAPQKRRYSVHRADGPRDTPLKFCPVRGLVRRGGKLTCQNLRGLAQCGCNLCEPSASRCGFFHGRSTRFASAHGFPAPAIDTRTVNGSNATIKDRVARPGTSNAYKAQGNSQQMFIRETSTVTGK